jgi:hypothetical protein
MDGSRRAHAREILEQSQLDAEDAEEILEQPQLEAVEEAHGIPHSNCTSLIDSFPSLFATRQAAEHSLTRLYRRHRYPAGPKGTLFWGSAFLAFEGQSERTVRSIRRYLDVGYETGTVSVAGFTRRKGSGSEVKESMLVVMM